MTTILHLTDTHIANEVAYALKGVAVRESLKAVLAHARRQDYDLWLATGDLAHDGSTAAYRWLAEALDAPPRLACLAGNHDDVQHLATALPMPKSLEMDGWRIVLLHTGVPGEDGGHLSESELSFLEETLSAVTQPTLIALHHPPVALGSRWLDAIGLSNAGEFWRLVERHHGVRAVLFGHAHQAYDAHRGAVRLLGTPSTCVQFLPHADAFALDARPPGYRTLRLSPDGRLDTAVHYLPA